MRAKKSKPAWKTELRFCDYLPCKNPFYPKRKKQRFHSSTCRTKAWMEGKERITVFKGTTEPVMPKKETAEPAIFPFVPNRLRKKARKGKR